MNDVAIVNPAERFRDSNAQTQKGNNARQATAQQVRQGLAAGVFHYEGEAVITGREIDGAVGFVRIQNTRYVVLATEAVYVRRVGERGAQCFNQQRTRVILEVTPADPKTFVFVNRFRDSVILYFGGAHRPDPRDPVHCRRP